MPAPKRKPATRQIHLPEVTVEAARDLIELNSQGLDSVGDQLLWLSKLDTAACQGTCKQNDKSNPNCFCALVPPEGSFKKKGLWKKEPDALGNLGADPHDNAREGTTPCGLNNLGNTCYVNSALQCLFMTPAFRWGLYNVESPVADQPIIAELRKLFLALDFGPKRVVHPATFANTLNLNHAIQQDGQEFFKLLVTKVQDLYAGSNNPLISSLVSRLFRGTFSYITICKECGNPSEGSSNATDFYELPLQVKGIEDLLHSMISALTAETLEGDNKYACDACMRKTDASRQQVLRTLPPYLCMQLQRFIFDYQKMDKCKVSDKFSFPMILDVPQVLACVAPDHDHGVATVDAMGQPAGKYELAAVLIHKGSSASHGHYVAHIKGTDGLWWRFDDETVTCMGHTPTSHPQDHGTTANAGTGSKAGSSKAGGKKAGGTAKRGARKGGGARRGGRSSRGAAGSTTSEEDSADYSVMDDSDEDMMDASDSDAQDTSKPRRKARGGRASGGAARGRGRGKRGGAAAKEGSVSPDFSGIDVDMTGGNSNDGFPSQNALPTVPEEPENIPDPATVSITSANAYMLLYRQVGWQEDVSLPKEKSQLPADCERVVEEEASAYEAERINFEEERQLAEQRVNERRAAVRTMLSCAKVAELTSPGGYVVPLSWLEGWCLEETPPPWDKTPLMCAHNKVDPVKLTEAKRVSDDAWQMLGAGVPPEATLPAPQCVCKECVLGQLQLLLGTVSADDVRKELEPYLSASEGLKASELPCEAMGGMCYVSKTWLQGWLKRKSGSMNTQLSPTSAIACPHGHLLPKAAVVPIPSGLWMSLKRLWLEAVQWERQQNGQGRKDLTNGNHRDPTPSQQPPISPSTHIKSDDDDIVMVTSDTEQANNTASKQQRPQRGTSHVPDGQGPAQTQEGGTQQQNGWGPAGAEPEPHVVDLPSGVQVCAICESNHYEANLARTQLKMGMDAERQALANLALNQLPDLKPGELYALVPRPWLAQWRAYVTQGPRRPGALTAPGTLKSQPLESKPRPGPLADALAQFLCPCAEHVDTPLLSVPMPKLVCRRNKFEQESPQTDDLIVITYNDYETLAEYYPPDNTAQANSHAHTTHAAPSQQPSHSQQDPSKIATATSAMPGTGQALSEARAKAVANAFTATVELCPLDQLDISRTPVQPPKPDATPQHAQQGPPTETPTDLLHGLFPNGNAQATAVVDLTDSTGAVGRKQHAVANGGAVLATPVITPSDLLQQAVILSTDVSTPKAVLNRPQCDVIEMLDDASPPATTASVQTPQPVQPAQPAAQGRGRKRPAAEAAAVAVATVSPNGRPRRQARVSARVAESAAMLQGGGDGGGSEGLDDETRAMLNNSVAFGVAEGGRVPALVPCPRVCRRYVEDAQAEAKRQRLIYEGVEVMCELFSGEEELSAVWQGMAGALAGGERRSRRARRNRQPLNVSSFNTLRELKLNIFQALNVHPLNAQVYVRGVKVEGDTKTLAELEIYPGEELQVLSQGDADPSDLTSVFASPAGHTKGPRRREVETGFRDTALLSSAVPRASGAAPGAAAARGADSGAAGTSGSQPPDAAGQQASGSQSM